MSIKSSFVIHYAQPSPPWWIKGGCYFLRNLFPKDKAISPILYKYLSEIRK